MNHPFRIALRRSMQAGACLALALIAPAAGQQPAASSLPFEELGQKLLAAADAGPHQPLPKTATLIERIAPLHTRIALGALELWVPEQVLGTHGELDTGPRGRDLAPSIEALIALEGIWVRRLVANPVELEACGQAVERLTTWAKGSRKLASPTGDQATQALERIERALLLAAPTRRTAHMIVIVAPSRAQYLGLLGAAGIVAPKERGRLWRNEEARFTGDWIDENVAVVALCVALRPDDSPLLGVPFKPEETLQWITHTAAHLLSLRVTPSAPTWWTEGLAIQDTIQAAGADETLCSGYAERSDAPVQSRTSAAEVLVWVTRELSPYRDEKSPTWFAEPLRKASTHTGFEILDLPKEKVALDLPGPFLGDSFVIDSRVGNASDGVRRGFAEFYRAYCTAFVHWLDKQEHGDHSLLAALCRELAKVPYDPKVKVNPLYGIAKTVSGKTLGSVYDAKTDLEGEFKASLGR